MLIQCTEKYRDTILSYIGDNYQKCLYLYIDLQKIGFSNENVDIWADCDEQNEICCVMLRYHTALHIYSKSMEFSVETIVKKIKEIRPAMICGIYDLLELFKLFLKDEYDFEYGFVGRSDNITIHNMINIEKAKLEDMREIAELICKEEMGRSFSVDDLTEQLSERFRLGFTRNYVIRADRKIVCHIDTSAELDNIALISGIVTLPSYRGHGFAKSILQALTYELINENREVFSFYYSPVAYKIHYQAGFIPCEKWTKMVIKNE